MPLRKTAVAGSWYPSAPERLTSEVERYLARAAGDEPLADAVTPVALVAPHAGLIYSGPVAAYAYRTLRHHRYDAIVLLGPSHYVAFDGVAIWPHGAFETPLGAVPVDEALAAAIQQRSALVIEHPAAHGREHSLEMQLPFLAVLAPGVPIVPLVMGLQTRETAFAIADAIGAAAQGRRVLLVASSDLSHFYDASVAAALDGQVMARVDAFDPEALMALLEQKPDHACGGGPIVSVLDAAARLGATTARVVRYGDSGDVSGDKSSVVGYMSAVIA